MVKRRGGETYAPEVPTKNLPPVDYKDMPGALSNEWASQGINVNAISPSYFSTEMTVALRGDEERAEELLGRITAGRWGEPEDLKGAVVFLASDAADYLHGAIVPVDGGWLGR